MDIARNIGRVKLCERFKINWIITITFFAFNYVLRFLYLNECVIFVSCWQKFFLRSQLSQSFLCFCRRVSFCSVKPPTPFVRFCWLFSPVNPPTFLVRFCWLIIFCENWIDEKIKMWKIKWIECCKNILPLQSFIFR